MATTLTVSSSANGSWWTGARLLKKRLSGALIGSNALASIGGGMQLLLHGWLAVAWGHNAIFLAVYAAARIGPKIALTVPAGILCDRMPRARILLISRVGYAVASLLPLVGLVAAGPIVWLLLGATLAGAIHAFDLSSARAVMGDIVAPEDMDAAVALNRAGGHVAALAGPALAFVLVSGVGSAAALAVSAVLLGASALAVLPLPHTLDFARRRDDDEDADSLVDYLRSQPAAVLLVMAGIVPTFIDKAVALLLPSVSGGGGGTVSMALVAPEVGALLAASVLAMSPVRLGVKALVVAALLYAGFISAASTHSHQMQALVIALGFAGMASAAINTSAQARLQRIVPAEMRGRVFAV